MTSHVMLSNAAAYALDCGLASLTQLRSHRIPFGCAASIFITHHHADHNIEYGPLLVVGCIKARVLTFAPSDPRRQGR